MDSVTETPPWIDNDHTYIHEGNAYSVHIYEATTAATLKLAFITPSTTVTYPYVHFRPIVAQTDKPDVQIKIYEGSSATSTMGTAVTAKNHNRCCTKTAGTVVRSGVTSTPSTTLVIAHYYMGGGVGQGQTAFGSRAEGIHEWVFQPDTVYQIDYEKSDATTKIGIELFFYEEENA
jgi:hypothetical protein